MEETQQYYSIKSWAEEDRPREKLLMKGREALSDAELLAILIGSGTKKKSAVDLSKDILFSIQNNLNQLGKISIHDLMKFPGIGEAKAISIAAALELGRRRKENSNPLKRDKITTSRDAFEILQSHLSDLPHEEFWVLLLNRANNFIKKVSVSKGGITGTVVDAKLILKSAIENLATSIVLCHNHPSGNLKPSQADIDLTKNLKQAGQMIDMQILDHIIIAGNGYFSFADEGMM